MASRQPSGLTHGSLFSGIGGFDLGFQWAGIRTIWQVEVDPYARGVLKRHFAAAKRYKDVRKVGKRNLAPVDIISGAFPAKISATPESAKESPESGPDYGPSTPGSLTSYDLESSSWRTSQHCLFGGLSEFWGTWPRSGMMRNGTVFELPTLVRHTDESEFGSLPTPKATEHKGGYSSQGGGDSLGRMATYNRWPTPTNSRTGDYTIDGKTGDQRLSLQGRAKLWPTPNVPNGGRSPKLGMGPTGMTPDGKKRQVGLENAVKMWPTPKGSPSGPDFARMDRAESGGDDLATAVARELFRTPSSRDWKGQSAESWRIRESGDSTPTLPDQVGGQLSPTWVEWLMGYPLEWTVLKAWGTRSSRKSRKRSAKQSKKGSTHD